MTTLQGQFPASIQAGLTLEKKLRYAQYPAPQWALSVLLRGPASINIEAQADDDDYQIAVVAADTSSWAAGQYQYSARVTDGTNILEVESGVVVIEADLATMPAGTDTTTYAQRSLAAIEAVLQKRASQDQQRYTINNRELWRTPIADLISLRNYFRAEVQRERSAKRGSLFGRQVRVTF